MDTTDLTEFDCVRIGDEAELNAWCGPQTHLFEDRVMKIGPVEIGGQVTVGAWSTILYDTQIGDGTQLGPLTLVAKGERLPPETRWEGSPAAAAETAERQSVAPLEVADSTLRILQERAGYCARREGAWRAGPPQFLLLRLASLPNGFRAAAAHPWQPASAGPIASLGRPAYRRGPLNTLRASPARRSGPCRFS